MTYNEYVKQSLQYYEQNKKQFDFTQISVYDIDNEAFLLLKLFSSKPNRMHISRFAVKKPGNGYGSSIIKNQQQVYNHITLWSKPETMQFYRNLDFVFDVNKTENGYVYGEWIK